MSVFLCLLGRPGTLRTYEYHAVALLAVLSFASFCLDCGLSVAFVCPFASSGPLSLFVCLSSVEGGRDAAFFPLFLLVSLSLIASSSIVYTCNY